MSRPSPQVVTPDLLRGWPLPTLADDKESGRVLVVAGSRSNPGGALLAVEAALRVGAGKVQVVTTRSTATALAVALPETRVQGVSESDAGELTAEAADVVVDLAAGCEAVLIGPGMGEVETARALAARVLPGLDTTVVLDALALAAVTEDPSCLEHLGGRALLTPNLRELARTLGWAQEKVRDDPREAALRLADRVGAVVCVGGPVTWTAHPDGRSWRGSVGGPALGTAGSGDVLAGLAVGLCARGAEPAQAGTWGSHLHGSAGDRLSAGRGQTGLLARELAGQVPAILAELSR